ncbi:hypothetical protein HDU85_003095 [Gaertneriomyces sp. JEL0708]|nr:hypothetical protein HDU85_003095 [Gaertneriomyces sp. JEL0708]
MGNFTGDATLRKEAPVKHTDTGDSPEPVTDGKGKDIIILLNGTSNTFRGDNQNTNIVKISQLLDRSYVQEENIYHRSGIGTFGKLSSVTLRKRVSYKLSVLTGADIDMAVLGVYKFLMNRYEPGDRVFMFGFSRGAYTAVITCAMISAVGLLTRGNEHEAQFAYTNYMAIQTSNDAEREKAKRTAESYKNTYCQKDVKIHFLGLFDAVSSVGDGIITPPTRYPWTLKLSIVKTLCHAVSLDERRVKYKARKLEPYLAGAQEFTQLWFPGNHCDIGGGYAPAGPQLQEYQGLTSNIPLTWMLSKAQEKGLKLKDPNVAIDSVDIRDRVCDLAAPLHDDLDATKVPRSGSSWENRLGMHLFWWALEFTPFISFYPRKSDTAIGSVQEYSSLSQYASGSPEKKVWCSGRRPNLGNYRYVPPEQWENMKQHFHWSVLERMKLDPQYNSKLEWRKGGNKMSAWSIMADYTRGLLPYWGTN